MAYEESDLTTEQLILIHHGILHQKWGVRRYQNYDGTLTEAGRLRYLADAREGEERIKSGYAKQQAKRDGVKRGRLRELSLKTQANLSRAIYEGTKELQLEYEAAKNEVEYRKDKYQNHWVFGNIKEALGGTSAANKRYVDALNWKSKAVQEYIDGILATSNQFMSSVSKKEMDAIGEYVYKRLGWDLSDQEYSVFNELKEVMA